ncbi:MAG: hypothetical protein KDB23_03800 [Planctomycetales bacterium]|nr:hypothetical protein [Planctomycetales bacterium]
MRSKSLLAVRFGVGSLLASVGAFAIVLAWWAGGSKKQQRAVNGIQSAVASNIVYENDMARSENRPMPLGVGVIDEASPRGHVATALQSHLGVDYVDKPIAITVGQDPRLAELGTQLGKQMPELPQCDQDDVIQALMEVDGLRELTIHIAIDDSDITSLCNLKQLERLYVSSEAVITDDGLAHIGDLRNLVALKLGLVDSEVQALSTIDIKGDGLAALAECSNLTRLDLNSPPLTNSGLQRIGELSKLKSLHIQGGTFDDDDLRFLAPLKELTSLTIVNGRINGTGLESLTSTLTKLKFLTLSGTNIGDDALSSMSRLKSLKSIMLYDTRITAGGLEKLVGVLRLSQIGLCPAIECDAQRLRRLLPDCAIINGNQSL